MLLTQPDRSKYVALEALKGAARLRGECLRPSGSPGQTRQVKCVPANSSLSAAPSFSSSAGHSPELYQLNTLHTFEVYSIH